MKNFGLIFLSFFLFYNSCKPKAGNTKTDETGKNDTTKFFQVSQYLQSQIAEVNKTPYFIYKTDSTGKNKDSSAINTGVFNQLAYQFLKPDINEKAIKKYYTESIFHDQTTKSFTISYTTSNKELEVQNIEILLHEDGQTVKRIFIRKFFNYSDSSAIEQLSWKPDESFQINRVVQKTGNRENIRQINVVWNAKH